ncbi:PREDICTED: solute carrier family 41 member 1-like [Cyprinodon variegatus]|uniref:solute carrier family 41 member 1-like n=1 Tax=Cyprinodon variegatus TaxID=28743 RepID=UPI000742B14C|nr:PREDICTED: solute carrier family 41 member 1-like [Cyprinodon variegatus]
MVRWSKEQDKLPDIEMSSGDIEMKKEGGPLTPAFLNSNCSIHPLILTRGPEEVNQQTGGEFELTEVTSFTERIGETGDDEERSDIVVALDCRANAKGQREEDALLENASQSNESDDNSINQSPEPPAPLKETSISIGLQVVFPFLLAGFGTVAAGMVLDIVQHWTVFTKVSEVFILVPALLGLKGNLEMTLASRLSTAVQATVVGFLASIAAVIFGWLPEGQFKLGHAVLLCASSVATAFIASLLLGLIMIGVIVASRKVGINPDNVATPIAASLGDLITLSLLAGISTGLYQELEYNDYANPLVCAAFVAMCPVWVLIARKIPSTREVLYSGWEPVIIAMAISSVGGLILDKTVSDPNFAGMAVFTPVINGVGGNLVAVQASRISTYLHMNGLPMGDPNPAPRKCPTPCTSFFDSKRDSAGGRILISASLKICALCLCFTFLQVAILLYLADWMVHWMWGRGMDPDNFSIPYLTALGDLLGTGFLALCFHMRWFIGDRDSNLGN